MKRFGQLLKIGQLPEIDPKYEQRLADKVVADSVTRAIQLCYFLVPIFFLYGFTSISFIQRFRPEATLWTNVWPRILLDVLPLAALARHLKRSRRSDGAKLLLWISGFSAIFHATAWIHIWPIALNGHPEILTYVHAANTFLFSFVFLFIAPPGVFLAPFTALLLSIFVLPLIYVAHRAGDEVVMKLIVNDSAFTIVAGAMISRMIYVLRLKVALLEIQKEENARRYLSPVVSKAIFDGQSALLEEKVRTAFVASIDVRSSTPLQNKDQEAWLKFRREYFRVVASVVARHRGYIQKTVGDRHVVSFGAVETEADLSDISGMPGVELDLRRAEEAKLARASADAFRCLDEIFTAVGGLGEKFFPDSGVRIGGGIDKGKVSCGVQGDESTALEFDVNGIPVNCSDRLEAFGKGLYKLFDARASLLVISPFASDYLREEDCTALKRITLGEMNPPNAIRDFPGIRWVFVKAYVPANVAREDRSRAA